MTAPMQRFAEQLEHDERLDGLAEQLSKLFDRYVKRGPTKDALAGTWFGHPIHPPLTAGVVGLFTATSALDVLGGKDSRKAADRLLGLGVLAALPTAATGWNELADTDGPPKRLAAVHGLANLALVAWFALAWVLRKAGFRGIGRMMALAGNGGIAATAYLGGHLSFVRGIGVNQTAFERPKPRWTAVMAEDDLKDGKPARANADGVEVVVIRHGDRLYALSNRCSHRGANLHRGKLDTAGRCPAIVCPWHGSTFCLDDGSIVRGPATSPQPAFEVRSIEGQVEVRPRGASI